MAVIKQKVVYTVAAAFGVLNNGFTKYGLGFSWVKQISRLAVISIIGQTNTFSTLQQMEALTFKFHICHK